MDNQNPTKRLLSIGEASEHLGVSIDTLRRWEKKGRIIPMRSPGGHRYYIREDLDALFGKRYTRDDETIRRTGEELNEDISREDSTPPFKDAVMNQDTAVRSTEPPSTMTSVDQNIPSQNIPSEELLHPLEAVTLPALETANRSEYPETQPPMTPIQEAVQQSPEISAPDTTSVPKPQNMVPPQEETASPIEVKVNEVAKPEENIPVSLLDPIPSKENESHSSEDQKADVGFSLPNISLPPQKNDQTLSEEEIEKRIGSIIREGKKDHRTDIFLGITLFIIIAVDIFILYTWFSSARIISPIP